MGQQINVVKAKNKLKNKGININAKGIKILKFSSNVNELVIQEIPLNKNQIQKLNQIKKIFFIWFFSINRFGFFININY